MRYIIRADASRSIGAGHVMRASAIAEEMIARGEEVVFVGKISDLPWVEERISSLGFTFIHRDSESFFSKPENDVLILDSYEIDVDDTFLAQENWLHIVVIVDDLTPNYSCTLKIHPGIDSDWPSKSKTHTLRGPKYIPFRSSLSQNLHTPIQVPHNLRIAIVAGGSDPYGLVHEFARILTKIPGQFEVYLFSTPNSADVLDSRFHYFAVGDQLDELTRDVDLVLTTASTSSLEFLARGLCVGIVCVVDNQKQNYVSLGKLGLAAQLGVRDSNNDWKLDESMVCTLITSGELRKSFIDNAKGIIDFNGARRIVDAILAL